MVLFSFRKSEKKRDRREGSRLNLRSNLFITQRRKVENNNRNNDENTDNDEGHVKDFFVFLVEKHGNYL
jgi:hypothetical protein